MPKDKFDLPEKEDLGKIYTSTFYCRHCRKDFKTNALGACFRYLFCYECSAQMILKNVVIDVNDKMFT